MKTRSREYDSPTPPAKRSPREAPADDSPPRPSKAPRKRASKKLAPPHKPQKRPAVFPLEVLEQVFYHSVEEVNEEITHTHGFPANGYARDNYSLYELINCTLDKDLNKFLQALKWKRIDVVQYGDHNVDPEAIRPLERLAERLEEVKRTINTLDVTLDCLGAVPPRVLELITYIFETVHKERIREVALCFALPAMNWEMRSAVQNQATRIDRLMLSIPTFDKLTTFKFLMGVSPYASESFIAFIIQQLPKLHTILLYGCSGRQKLKEYKGADLGDALASRTELKSLNIRSLRSFTNHWLYLEWKPKLEELTVKTEPAHTPNFFFDETQRLGFCHLFHRTLVSLNFDRGLVHHPIQSQDVQLAESLVRDFSALKYLTYGGNEATLWAFSHLPILEQLTWSISGRGLAEKNLFKQFQSHCPPTEGRWPSLKRVNLPEHARGPEIMEEAIQILRTFLQQHDIQLDFLEHPEVSGLDESSHDLNSRLYPKPIRLRFQS